VAVCLRTLFARVFDHRTPSSLERSAAR
jgi:hypothetical protein